MENYIQKSPRALRREQARKIKKQFINRELVPANKSFSKIKTELVRMGWTYIDDFVNIVVLDDSIKSTCSPAIKLVTEKFNITILPHRQGLEISKLEVWEAYQGLGYASLFLDNLLRFLILHGVKDIYLLPGQAGTGKSLDSLVYNQYALKRFYQRRGFIEESRGFYWKLSVTNIIDIGKLDLGILSKSIPSIVCV
jgi:GNAT superfamily N-acetyltransferase